DRHSHRVHHTEMARPAQDGATRAIADVAARQHQYDARRVRIPWPAIWPARRIFESCAIQPAPIQPPLRASAGDARFARTYEAAAQDVGARRGLCTVGDHGVSYRECPRPAVGSRLQIQSDVPVSVPVSRCRRLTEGLGGKVICRRALDRSRASPRTVAWVRQAARLKCSAASTALSSTCATTYNLVQTPKQSNACHEPRLPSFARAGSA